MGIQESVTVERGTPVRTEARGQNPVLSEQPVEAAPLDCGPLGEAGPDDGIPLSRRSFTAPSPLLYNELVLATRPVYTLEDYVSIEAESGLKHEFVAGQILAMAGGTVAHGRLGANVLSVLRSAVRGTDCMALSSDVRIGHAATDFRAYPDASVICGPPRYAARPAHTVTNPVCVVDVLSNNTASYDQGEKLLGYKSLAAVQSIVFVSQDSRSIVVHGRRGDTFEVASLGAGEQFELPGIPGPIAVDDIYD